jgi:hypothetical protein
MRERMGNRTSGKPFWEPSVKKRRTSHPGTSPKPLRFTEFCEALGVKLEPGQLVLARVAFDGVEPRDLEGEERDIARSIFGPDVEVISPVARRALFLVCGGRSGKSYIFIALRMLHLALTVPLTTLAPGEAATVNITAPDLDLADQDLSYIRGAIRRQPQLLAMAVHGAEADSKSDYILLRRKDGDVVIKCRAASGRGKTGRGRSILGFGMDEGAFFQDTNHKVNDRDVYDAQAPRVVPGGQGVFGSTPWAEDGLLWEKYEQNWNRPTDCLVAHAPTTLMRTDPVILDMVAAAYANPAQRENAEREFGARFMRTEDAQYFDGGTLDKMFTDEEPTPAPPGAFVTAGGDLGFVRNSSALAAGWCMQGKYLLTALEERKPSAGAPLKPSLVCKEFASIARAAGADSVMADGHYAESAKEHFEEEGREAAAKRAGAKAVYFLTAPTDKPAVFARARDLAREGRVQISNKLPLAARLRKQLRGVKSRPLAGGGMSITAPEATDGSHADLVSAFVLALWQQHGAEVRHAPPAWGTPAFFAAEEARIEAQLLAQYGRQEREWHEGGTTEWH